MSTRARTLLRLLPALAWMLMIFMMSSQPGGDSGAFSRLVLEWLAGWGLDLRVWFGDHAFWVIRKMAHFTEYLILFLLLDFGLAAQIPWHRRRWWALGITIFYAATDEFHQLFVPRRVGDVQDVLIDALGAFAALAIRTAARAISRAWRRPSPR